MTNNKAESVPNESPIKKSEVIDFNVGGSIFATLKSTLTPKIKKLNSSSFYDLNLLQRKIIGLDDVTYDKNRVIFLDRNPKHFQTILDYLRMASIGESLEFSEDLNVLKSLLKEAIYYEIDSMIDAINFKIKQKNDRDVALNKAIIAFLWILMIILISYFSKFSTISEGSDMISIDVKNLKKLKLSAEMISRNISDIYYRKT
jgi:hypothetical protein